MDTSYLIKSKVPTSTSYQFKVLCVSRRVAVLPTRPRVGTTEMESGYVVSQVDKSC